MNRDHSVIFETAFKYSILDAFFDHDGYSISSEGFLPAEYIMQNAKVDEAQAGIKIARRNINNLRYTDDTNLMAESKEELKNLLMKVTKESEKLA